MTAATRIGSAALDLRPIRVRVRARRELADTRPAGAQAVPDAAERPDRRELARPVPLGVQERPGIASLDPEQERVRGEDERCDCKLGEVPPRSSRAPREDRERREQRDGNRACEQSEPACEPRSEEAPSFCGQERDDREHEVERLAVDGLEEERHREQREVEHRPACAVGSDLSLGEAVEEHERRQACRERDDDPGEHVVAEQDASEQADSRRVEREEGRGRAGEVLVAVLGDPEEPDAVPARPDVGDRTEIVRDGGIVPASGVGVSARLEDEQREERRRPDRQAAPDEDLDSRIARGDASGQVARLGAWLPKPLTRAHNGRIIRAWSSGTSQQRRRTRRSWRCVRSRRSWSAHRRALVELQERQSALTTRIAGNGGNVEPHELEEVQEHIDEEVAGIARCVARIHEVGALVEGPRRTASSTSRRPATGRTCCSAGDWARTRSPSGTAWTRASRAASLSSCP